MGFWSNHNPMEDFQTNKWGWLSGNEKLSRLQSLENSMAAEQGRLPREVTTYHGEGCGYYDRNDPGKLYINEDYIYSTTPGEQYDAMNTVIHEGRHAYQHDCIDGRISHNESEDTLSMWNKNNEIYNVPDDNFSRYRFQPIEVDANDYADSKMEAFNDFYGKDANYRNYIESVNDNKQDDIDRAIRDIGPNYQENIANQIASEYDWNYGYISDQNRYDKMPESNNESLSTQGERGQKPTESTNEQPSESSNVRGQKPSETPAETQGNNSSSRGEKPQETPTNTVDNFSEQPQTRGVSPSAAENNPPQTPTSQESTPSNDNSGINAGNDIASTPQSPTPQEPTQNAIPNANGMSV